MKNPLLSMQKISLELPFKEEKILDEINFDIYPGDFVFLLGSNGSGKSSLIKTINGLSSPTSGKLFFKGQSLLDTSIHKRSRSIATLMQDLRLSTFSDLSVLENCRMAIHRDRKLFFSKKEREEEIAFYLKSYNPRLSEKLKEPVSTLSGGERQTLALAMCLWNTPQLLLLDEHTSALDPHRAEKLMEITYHKVKENSITAIVSTHKLEDALRYGNRILAIRKGKIIRDFAGEQKKALTKERLLPIYTI